MNATTVELRAGAVQGLISAIVNGDIQIRSTIERIPAEANLAITSLPESPTVLASVAWRPIGEYVYKDRVYGYLLSGDGGIFLRHSETQGDIPLWTNASPIALESLSPSILDWLHTQIISMTVWRIPS